MQTLALAPAHRCLSILSTMSEPSTLSPARLRLQAISLVLRNFSSFGQATASPSGQTRTPASWRSVGSPLTAPGTSGGISYLQGEIASNRPKPIGRWQDLILYPATPSSALFPSLRPDEQSPNVTGDGTFDVRTRRLADAN